MTAPHRTVGVALPPFRGVIERVKVVEYAQAVHIKNPIHFDRNSAISAGFRDIVVPPGFLNPFSLQPRSSKFEVYKINEHKALAGEWAWDHRGVVCAGDELHGQSVLVGVSEKQGRRPMNVLVIETKYLNQKEEVVAVLTDVTLEFKD